MSNTYHGILIHVIFSTKYRRPILNQAWRDEHHEKLDFKSEYLAILRKHGIEFDLKYVFDEEIIA